jgi:hypothetical protein
MRRHPTRAGSSCAPLSVTCPKSTSNGRRYDLVNQFATHPTLAPEKHRPAPQLQTCTWWLSCGAQPQPPIEHVFGKSLVPRQQRLLATVPPDSRHTCSGAGVGATVGVLVAATEGASVGDGVPAAVGGGHPFRAAETTVSISSIVTCPSVFRSPGHCWAITRDTQTSRLITTANHVNLLMAFLRGQLRPLVTKHQPAGPVHR